MIEFNKLLIFKIIYLLVAYLVVSDYQNHDLAMAILFLPYLTTSIIVYRKFEQLMRSKHHIILSKSNFNFWNIGFAGLVVLLCLFDLTIYTGLLLLSALTYLFIEYTISKRRILTINNSGIDALGKNKHRKLKEITSLEIYPNNVEFRFNKNEILQINKNDLIHPTWTEFVDRITHINAHKQETTTTLFQKKIVNLLND
ncbi:hypothetical protein [Olleya sp. HaHaR_3_96]|uniref:hypothetical protein n=1 Tax=Olleya sp. HaHaR_3_96 TaxID=2745560 RepID=UPI001C4ECC53|nr:hypothetical protein [Olleya sp. HaHaR_3_96]QXP61580.1 hypothetical protein H0I26_08100 [Olleya sp. HaHaR_3_96]